MTYSKALLNDNDETAARSINNAAVIHRVTISLATRVRKFIQADGGHSEQFA
jgi:hypothetical protein